MRHFLIAPRLDSGEARMPDGLERTIPLSETAEAMPVKSLCKGVLIDDAIVDVAQVDLGNIARAWPSSAKRLCPTPRRNA